MKVSIEKELNNQKEKDKIPDSEICQVKLLLDSNASEDLRIAKALGSNHSLVHGEKLYGKVLELENLDKNYNGKVFKLDQIKALAIKYNLRFLRSSYFIGNLDVEVISKIKEFSKETNTTINTATLEREFFILAPEECFELEDHEIIRKKDLDPAIFYRIDVEHYRLIHKWGVDFTILRRLSGFKYENYSNCYLFTLFTTLPVVAFIFTLLDSSEFLYEYTIAFCLLTSVVSIFIAYLRMWNMTDDWESDDRFYSPSKWNNNRKYKYTN